MEIVILGGAETELFEAWKRYEELMPGLGDRFDGAVRGALNLAAQFPEAAPRYYSGNQTGGSSLLNLTRTLNRNPSVVESKIRIIIKITMKAGMPSV